MNTKHAQADNLTELDPVELALVYGGTDLGANVLEKIAPTEQRVWMQMETIWHSYDPYFTTVGTSHPGDTDGGRST